MNILIGIISLLLGAGISFYIFNKRLFIASQKNIQLETKLDEKEKNYAEKLQLVEHLKNQVNNEFKTIASDILKSFEYANYISMVSTRLNRTTIN